jgi:adenosylmethionine-8-amino-7-oxononanoate aminotransferase
VAAFIAEPMQGAGGVIIPPATYWPEIQRIVDKYGILLISDEVICAFGRLGHWFAYEKFGYKPDLVTFAKAVTSGYIPLGGVMVGDRVAKVLIEQGGSSTTATPTAGTRWPARWHWPIGASWNASNCRSGCGRGRGLLCQTLRRTE